MFRLWRSTSAIRKVSVFDTYKRWSHSSSSSRIHDSSTIRSSRPTEEPDTNHVHTRVPEKRNFTSRKEKAEYLRRKWFGNPTSLAEDVSLELHKGTDSMTVLKRHLESPSELDMHVLSSCVDALWLELSTIPRRKRAFVLQPIKEQGIARSTLLRIWQQKRDWEVIIRHDHALCERLCFLAVSEGLEHYIKEWIGTDVHIEGKDSTTTWRGNLLRALCFAHGHCDFDRKSDSALQCFFDMVDRRSAAFQRHQPGLPASPLMHCSLFPAIVELDMIIRTPQLTTKTEYYERFRRIVHATNVRGEGDGALLRARLDLYHPEKPLETSMLELLREQDAHGVDDGSVLPVMSQIKTFGHTIQKTIAVALLNGNTESAKWVQRTYGHFVQHDVGLGRTQQRLGNAQASPRRATPSG